MSSSSHPYKGNFQFMEQQDHIELLRLVACGSVDDGKSSLIGRLLYDLNLVFDDQLRDLQRESKRRGCDKDTLDYSLLLDGLEDEMSQGITIDVAYRFFATPKRKFIVADAPGHEEYTGNMATGASTADLAVVIIDAQKGVLTQTKRHTYIAALLGISQVVLAVNKMDLISYDEVKFQSIFSDYRSFATHLGLTSIQAVPVSATTGCNVVRRTGSTPWYSGPTLLEYLDNIDVYPKAVNLPFRLPVQFVIRPDQTFRGFAGQVASGSICVGDELVSAKSGQSSRVGQIVTKNGLLDDATAGDAVTVVLNDEIDVSRGDFLVSSERPPHLSDQLQAHLIWFNPAPMIPGRSYVLQTETDCVTASVTSLKYLVNVNTLNREHATTLPMNGVGVCNLSLSHPIVFDAYVENRSTGNFILIDRYSNATVGAGLIDFPLRRAANIHWQSASIGKGQRCQMKAQRPAIIWFTGLSGSGKSTIANRVEAILYAEGRHTYLLDGDNLRHGLSRNLGFTEEDRVENIRRVAEVAKLMADAGLIVLVALISPFAAERKAVRDIMPEGEFFEVFVDTPLEECARRDPKGLYKKAKAGEIANFTGISSPYEVPEAPDIHVRTVNESVEDMASKIVSLLSKRSS